MQRVAQLIAAAAVGTGLLLSHPAAATVVTSQPIGVTTLPLPGVNYTGIGPQTIASGITWTASGSGAKFGGQFGTSFDHNWWDLYGTTAVPNYFVNTDGHETMTVTFDAPVAVFGGLFDWKTGGSPTVAVYDANNNLLDSILLTTLTAPTANNGSQFVGFVESSDVIAKMVISGGFVGMSGLVEDTVPEPATLSLLGFGMLGLAALRRRRR